MSDHAVSPTVKILESDLDIDTKKTLLEALMSASRCRDCAREAHKALHKLESPLGAI